MRTKAEVVNFLDSKVGTTIPDKVNSNLNGQCVTLIKALLEFVAAPNPYSARGNAKDYANSLLNQSIATNGKGLVNVVVNPTMGVVGSNVYGHIWVEIDGQNWESNGAKALVVTKNTRPSIQGRQWVNLDKWITRGEDMITSDLFYCRRIAYSMWGVNGYYMKENALNGDMDQAFKNDPAWIGSDPLVCAQTRFDAPEGSAYREWAEKQAQGGLAPAPVDEYIEAPKMYIKKEK